MGIHINAFSDKVRAMNQTKSKNLILSATEAQNLYTEIFNLLCKVVELGTEKETSPSSISLSMDGGKFR